MTRRSTDGPAASAKDKPGKPQAQKPDEDPLTQNLKRAFDEVTEEPIPQAWLDLVSKLESQGGAAQDSSPTDEATVPPLPPSPP